MIARRVLAHHHQIPPTRIHFSSTHKKDCFSIQNTYFSIINPGPRIEWKNLESFFIFIGRRKAATKATTMIEEKKRMLGIVSFSSLSLFSFSGTARDRIEIWEASGCILNAILYCFSIPQPIPEKNNTRWGVRKKTKESLADFHFSPFHCHYVWPEVLCSSYRRSDNSLDKVTTWKSRDFRVWNSIKIFQSTHWHR